MSVPTYTYSGVVYTATADQTTFALTTSGGKSIGYLKQEHIKVRTSADGGNTWTGLVLDTDYVFADPATSIVLSTGAAVGTLVDISRHTPMEDDYIDFQAGSLLTAYELNLFDTWQLYIDQELYDRAGSAGGGSNISSTDDLPEGVVNLYYTDARVESYVSGAGYIKDAGVTRLIAGSNVTLSPSGGTGDVTISATGGGGGGGFTYKGEIDATGPAPSSPQNGDMWVNTGSGVVGSGWTGITGDPITGNERLIYSSTSNDWALLVDNGIPEAPDDGVLYGRQNKSWVSTYWTLSGSNLFPSDGSYKVGIGGSSISPNIVLNDDGSAIFVSSVQASAFRVDLLSPLP